MRKLLVAIGVALSLAWFALVITTSGILVYSMGPFRPAPNYGQDALRCTYFTGLGTVSIDFWHDEQGIMGAAVCPRLRKLQ